MIKRILTQFSIFFPAFLYVFSITAFAKGNNDSDTGTINKMLFFGVLVLALIALVLFLLSLYRLCEIKRLNKISKMTDAETGIGNLLYFEHHFNNTITDYSRTLYYVAYIIVDSNYLQVYHDKLAFSEAVRYTAKTLSESTGHGEICARITESGFVYAFKCNSTSDAENVVNNLISKLNKFINDQDITGTKRIFYSSIYNLQVTDRNCDLLIFNLRKNCNKIIGTDKQYIICNNENINKAIHDKRIFENLVNAFKANEFKLYLQFIVENKTKKIVSAEALSRWIDGDRNITLPGKFIKDLENSGLISQFDLYMFEKVCAQLDKWHKTEFSNISISCNITRITLSEEDFIQKISEISNKYNFDRSKLILEITEEAMESNLENAKKNVSEAKNLGFRFALDDLGSGYTSLLNLCDYPIDIAKIDRNILLKAGTEKGKRLFLGIIALAHSLNMRVICEGVETDEQNQLVCESDCDAIQGWYYSNAIPESEWEQFIKEFIG